MPKKLRRCYFARGGGGGKGVWLKLAHENNKKKGGGKKPFSFIVRREGGRCFPRRVGVHTGGREDESQTELLSCRGGEKKKGRRRVDFLKSKRYF